MAENPASPMNRRSFIYQTMAYIMGGMLGLNGFSKVFACDQPLVQPRISLIIDDIGFNRSRARMFLDLDIPLTFSILPRLRHSSRLAEEIHHRGHDVMLHQPMEPHNPSLNPGPGALYVGDGGERISRIMEENISDTPFIKGVNNHMGSRFTASEKDVREVLSVIKDKSLFFIDSLTTPQSKAYQTAKDLHLSTANRNFFLDFYREESAISSQLHKLLNYAMRHGHAIGIGHPYPETALSLKAFLPRFIHSNVSLIHISNLLPSMMPYNFT
ncbi:MAG: divergent polysaccharide deacetylase family protein [Deltaproteobacteria bacterium]|nr:divergent polysaccharide deacetylase family protein [Deltaproteobacteria bacterium]